MKKTREVIFSGLYFLFLIIILLNFAIHVVRTMKFNQTTRSISSTENYEGCSFNLSFRGGASDSWLKRDVEVENKMTTLKGSTFDGVFINDSPYEISDWDLLININENCYINNCWCGTVEIHQKDKVQVLDLRNFNKNAVILEGYNVGQDYMLPLRKGDFIVYHPSLAADEAPVHANNGLPGTVTIGMILYTDVTQDFKLSNYTVYFHFHKKIFQGSEAMIFMVLITVWLFILAAKIIFRLAYKKAAKEAERKLAMQRMEDMKSYNAKLNADVEAKTAHIKEIQQKVVIGLANVIGNRDYDTGGHVKRTSDIIKIILDEYRKQNNGKIDNKKAYDIIRAAPMHDLGKIYVDTSILCKPGKLTDEEFEKMKKHAENSGDIVMLILKGVEEQHFVDTAFNVARHHHERWDGKGYPDHLSGETIPLEARIMAVADVYDALVSKRCYKQPMSFEKAYEIMCEGMGSQFDPAMKDIFIACHEKLEQYYRQNR